MGGMPALALQSPAGGGCALAGGSSTLSPVPFWNRVATVACGDSEEQVSHPTTLAEPPHSLWLCCWAKRRQCHLCVCLKVCGCLPKALSLH